MTELISFFYSKLYQPNQRVSIFEKFVVVALTLTVFVSIAAILFAIK